jgi:hypothetical protein
MLKAMMLKVMGFTVTTVTTVALTVALWESFGPRMVFPHCAEAAEHVWCTGVAIPPRPLVDSSGRVARVCLSTHRRSCASHTVTKRALSAFSGWRRTRCSSKMLDEIVGFANFSEYLIVTEVRKIVRRGFSLGLSPQIPHPFTRAFHSDAAET